MNKKILLILLTSCILFNNSIALFALDKQPLCPNESVSNPVFGQIPSVQSPFMIMNSLIYQGVPLFPEFKKPAKTGSQNGDSKNNDLCLLSSSSSDIKSACKYNNNLAKENPVSNTQDERTFERYLFYMKLLNGINSLFSIFMLMFLVSLSKSNLPWEINSLSR